MNPKDIDSAPIQPYRLCQLSTHRICRVINEPATQIVDEDGFKGGDVMRWAWTDAIHFVLQGEAEEKVWRPRDLAEKPVEIVEPLRVYLIPRRAPVHWRVLSYMPFRKFGVGIPKSRVEAIA